MNRFDKQEKFFKFLNYIVQQNHFSFEKLKSFVYSSLIHFDITENEKKYNITDMFYNWLDEFKDVKNIQAFYDTRWNCFFQFNNNVIDVNTAIKLYIPMDFEHIYRGTNELFKFLSQENISHLSKVRNCITVDNVVIRVNDMIDADKISNFVKNNDYIREGLINPNPFLFTNDNIGYAIDGKYESFNGLLCDTIADYIQEVGSDYHKINLTDFSKKLNSINVENQNYNININWENSNIIKLALMALDSSENFDSFRQYSKIRKNYYDNDIHTEDILKDAIKVMNEKYGEIVTINQLKKYISSGNEKNFTRDNDIRRKVSLYLNEELVKDIINSNVASDNNVENFVQNVINKSINEEKMCLLEDASIATYIKYENQIPGQLSLALNSLIYANEYSYFTNDNNCREKLKMNVLSQDVFGLIREQLIMDNVIKKDDYIDNLIDLYVNYIEQKINSSYYKYNTNNTK